MHELRIRTRIPASELEQKVGKLVTDRDSNALLTGCCKVQKPDGTLLCVYLPKAVELDMMASWSTLQRIHIRSDNRGHASGTLRANAGGKRSRTMPVQSGILGAMDPAPRQASCRLTHYTREHLDRWSKLHPLLRTISELFKLHVPNRYQAQAFEAHQTHDDWVVPGTVFTTITVNNSYATGVHTDKGDLEAGFSCLAVGKHPNAVGGKLTFPQYRLAVDMQHGDLLLMDAHEWHGNTALFCRCGQQLNLGPCSHCGAERISVVCYYRTKMRRCGSLAQEETKREAAALVRSGGI